MTSRRARSRGGAIVTRRKALPWSTLAVLAALLAAVVALGVIAARGQGAPTLDQQAHEIAAGLRCPVCRDLSAADSPAPLARQMREQITDQLRAGRSAEEIRQGFVAAYGDTVLMAPPRQGTGAVAYLLPVVLPVAGAGAGLLLLRRWRRRAGPGEPGPEPSAVQRRRVARAVARLGAGIEPDDGSGGGLLLQLRDLDDDLAAGKLTVDDHARLRAPVEREAAAALRSDAGWAQSGRPARPARSRAGGAGRRRRVWPALLVAGAAATAGVAVLLSGALAPRGAGASMTGDPPAAAITGDPPAAAITGDPPAAAQPSPAQLAAVEAAVAGVRDHPDDPVAHLALARAYAAADAQQLAAVEYLAVTRLDPAQPEATTALALTAFAAGRPDQAQDMVDTVLAAHPGYPDGLYARGLIRLMGLQQPDAARADLTAYLAAAPAGSHRGTVQTLLTMISEGTSR